MAVLSWFNLSGGAGPANIVFHSDWSTATGSGDAALRDTNQTIPWDGRNGDSSTGLNIIAGNSLPNSRPAPPDGIVNVCQVIRATGAPTAPGVFCGMQSDGSTTAYHWTDLAVDEALYTRVYTLMDVANSEGDKYNESNHPFEWWLGNGGGAASNIMSAWYNYGPMADGTFTWAIHSTVDGTTDNQIWTLGTFNGTTQYGDQLPKFVWYRFEHMVRHDSGGYSMAVRVYNASGTLLYSEDGVGASLGTVKNATGTQVTMKSKDGGFAAPATSDVRAFFLGHNGGSTYTATQYYYWAAVAIAKGTAASTTWIGPYSGGI